jgi:hypothetical protein
VTATEDDGDVRHDRSYQVFDRVREQAIIVTDENYVVTPCIFENPFVVFGRA